ncbi:hypothetical protein U1Q18_020610 [Sarracenia purpurea var. burkii]
MDPTDSLSTGGFYDISFPPVDRAEAQPLPPNNFANYTEEDVDQIILREIVKIQSEKPFYTDEMKRAVVQFRVSTNLLICQKALRMLDDPDVYEEVLNRVRADRAQRPPVPAPAPAPAQEVKPDEWDAASFVGSEHSMNGAGSG